MDTNVLGFIKKKFAWSENVITVDVTKGKIFRNKSFFKFGTSCSHFYKSGAAKHVLLLFRWSVISDQQFQIQLWTNLKDISRQLVTPWTDPKDILPRGPSSSPLSWNLTNAGDPARNPDLWLSQMWMALHFSTSLHSLQSRLQKTWVQIVILPTRTLMEMQPFLQNA